MTDCNKVVPAVVLSGCRPEKSHDSHAAIGVTCRLNFDPVIIGTSRASRRKADATATPERCPLTGVNLGPRFLTLPAVNTRPRFPSQSSMLVPCLLAYEPMPEACHGQEGNKQSILRGPLSA